MIYTYIIGAVLMILVDGVALRRAKTRDRIVYLSLTALFVIWAAVIGSGRIVQGPEEIINHLYNDILHISMENW